MNREEMIDILIQDRINEWVHAKCHETLEEFLYIGWKGYEDYSNEELYDAFEELCEDNFDDATALKIKMYRKAMSSN